MALVAVLGLVAVLLSREIEQALRGEMTENVPTLRAVAGLELALIAQKGLVANHLLESSNPRWTSELDRQREVFRLGVEEARRSAVTAEERKMLDAIVTRYSAYDQLRQRVLDLCKEGHTAEAVQLQTNQVAAAAQGLHDECERILALNEGMLAASVHHATTLLDWLRASTVAGLCAVLLLGSLGGWLAARAVQRQLFEKAKLAALGEIAGSVAHELRNPLAAIELRLEALRGEKSLSTAARLDLEVIRDELVRLGRVASNFLGVSQYSEPRFAEVELPSLVARVAAVLGATLTNRGVELNVALAPNLPPLWADADQMHQVLINLLLNAAQALPAEGKIALTASRTNSGDLELRIADTGPGIASAVRRRMFEPFVTTRKAGIGLGLFIVRRIVEKHRGNIELDGRARPGTTFVLTLPTASGMATP